MPWHTAVRLACMAVAPLPTANARLGPGGLSRRLAQLGLRPLPLGGPGIRVGVDGTPLLGPRTGIGQFCAGALSALGRRSDLDVGAFALSWRTRKELDGEVPEGIRRIGAAMPARPLRLVWSKSSFPPLECFTGPMDVVHGMNYLVPPARRAARVVSVYDLTVKRFPEMCHPSNLAFSELVRRAVSEGAWVHVLSSFVAEEVMEHFGAPRSRVRVVYPGLPTKMDGSRSAPPGRPDLPDWVTDYVLALGTVEPRKNLAGLVEAFDSVAAGHPGLALVIAGQDGWGVGELNAAIAACGNKGRIIRLGWVSHRKREALLAHATLLAYPSRYEGFGFPPLEAMAEGVAVVATTAGSLPEVLGEGAVLVEPGDTSALAGAIDALISDPDARVSQAAQGRDWVKRYGWEACADGLASLYGDAFSQR